MSSSCGPLLRSGDTRTIKLKNIACRRQPQGDPYQENVKLFNRDNPDLPLGLYVGVVTTESGEIPFDDLLKEADSLM